MQKTTMRNPHSRFIQKRFIPSLLRGKEKVTLRFRGREMAHQEIGMRLIERVRADLEEYGVVEQFPKMEGRQMVMVLSPKPKKKEKEVKEKAAKASEAKEKVVKEKVAKKA